MSDGEAAMDGTPREIFAQVERLHELGLAATYPAAATPAQGAEGIRRVALPPPLHLHVQHLCRAGQLRRGQRGHLQTLGGIGATIRPRLMRRDAGGDQQQKVQPQLLRRRLCRRDMTPVNGVKGPAVNTDLHITRSSSGP